MSCSISAGHSSGTLQDEGEMHEHSSSWHVMYICVSCMYNPGIGEGEYFWCREWAMHPRMIGVDFHDASMNLWYSAGAALIYKLSYWRCWQIDKKFYDTIQDFQSARPSLASLRNWGVISGWGSQGSRRALSRQRSSTKSGLAQASEWVNRPALSWHLWRIKSRPDLAFSLKCTPSWIVSILASKVTSIGMTFCVIGIPESVPAFSKVATLWLRSSHDLPEQDSITVQVYRKRGGLSK